MQYFPSVSIIVPVYNGEKTVGQCVESLLAQNYPKDRYEIIIVDNKSNDHTQDVLHPYIAAGEITLLTEITVLNAYGARNTGIRGAKGEILAFTDADCIADPNWLSEFIGSFHDPDVGCVAGEILPAKPKNVIEKYWDTEFLSQKRDIGKAVPGVRGGSCAFRKDVFDLVGLFREDFPSGGDGELAIRMVTQTKLKIFMSLDAVVRHHNVSSLRAFIKQSLRYGTHISNFIGPDSNKPKNTPSFYRAAINTFVFLGSSCKRCILISLGRRPSSVPLVDRDIYILRPILRIISEWAVWCGYRFALQNPNSLR